MIKKVNKRVNQTEGSSVALIAVKFSGRRWLPLALCLMKLAFKVIVTRANPGNRMYLTAEPSLAAALENGILRREKPSEK